MRLPFERTLKRPGFRRILLPFTIALMLVLGAMTAIAGL